MISPYLVYHRRLVGVLQLVSLCAFLPWSIAPTQAADKNIVVVSTDTPPTIDGRLDEAVWSSGAVVDELTQIDPVEGADPSEKTLIRVLYGVDAIYIGARLYDSQPEGITANYLSQGSAISGDDRFEVQIDPFLDRRSGYSFQVNPNGVRAQGIYQNITSVNLNWSGIWYVATSRDSEGWIAEIAIPYKSISFDPNSSSWGINFARVLQRTHETQSWTYYNRRYTPDNFGTAEGLVGLRQGVGLDVTPALVATTVRDDRIDVTTNKVKPSLNVVYRLTPAVTASATVNTDFSATQADSRQIQLSRFGLFFPEKRDFFLQDADIFEFGGLMQNGRPFFSRRMGLGSDGDELAIRAGGKITARMGRWNIGVLDVNQERGDGEGNTNLAVARVTGNFGDRTTLGVLATSGNPENGERSNLVGADMHFFDTSTFESKTIDARAWYQKIDNTPTMRGDDAFGVLLGSPNQNGWQGLVQYTEIGENFRPALGFVNRTGMRETYGYTGYKYRPTTGGVQLISTDINASRTTDLRNVVQSEAINSKVLSLTSRANDQLSLNVNSKREVLTAPFNLPFGNAVPVGDYRFTMTSLVLQTAVDRKLSGSLDIGAGGFYDGQQQHLGSSLTWLPSPHFSGGLSYDQTNIKLHESRFTTRIYSVNATVAFNSAWAWFNLVQFDNVSRQLGLNSRLRWIPKPGAQVYVVVNMGAINDDIAGWQRQELNAAISAGYTIRF
ncbi:MAG: DUF5916 domain-containing protein [Steroidobacteraceae bacterium]